MSPSRKPWFDRAFGDLYPQVYAHRDEVSAAREFEFVKRVVPILSTHKVLDLGCGAGRHIDVMLSSGMKSVYGLDRSWSLLSKVSAKSKVLRGDMRSLPFVGNSFDVITSFFTSFGYFETSLEDRSVLEEVVRVLKPKGRYFLDYLDASHVRRFLIPRSERRVEDLLIVEERSIIDSRVVKCVSITLGDGHRETYEESVRLYDADEMVDLMGSVGLRPIATFSDIDGRPPGVGSRWIVVAEREAG